MKDFIPEEKILRVGDEEIKYSTLLPLKKEIQFLRSLEPITNEIAQEEITTAIFFKYPEALVNAASVILGRDKKWIEEKLHLKDLVEVVFPFYFKLMRGLNDSLTSTLQVMSEEEEVQGTQ